MEFSIQNGVAVARFENEPEVVLFVSATADVLRCERDVWDAFTARDGLGLKNAAVSELEQTLIRLGIKVDCI